MSKIKNLFSSLKIREWPSRSQWKHFFKILTKKEKIIFSIFFFGALISLIYLSSSFYLRNTEIQPARGGNHIEGVIGQPRFINPIYANSDVDRDLVQLIFSGLMKYDENLQIVPDLVQKYEIEEDGKVYKFYLKENILWQDKKRLTADDVIFTIKTIQNPDYKSPLRANWVGVDVEKISDLGVKFSINRSYSAFLENCTIKILPKHIWKDISPENFPLAIYNLKPLGSGPYKLKEIKQDKSNLIESLTLVPNPFYFERSEKQGSAEPKARHGSYFGKSPYLSEIKFLFFDKEEELIKIAKSRKIKGFSLNSYRDFKGNWQVYYLPLPRYFAVFFNQKKSKILAEKEIRMGLNYGVNKKEIVKKILNPVRDSEDKEKAQKEHISNGVNLPDNSEIIETKIVHSPILPDFYGFDPPTFIYEFDPEKAKELLEEAGFIDEDGDGLREKNIEKELVFQFKRELKSGSKGKEVEELQKCLAKFPDIYPEGEVTGYFGEKTKTAVITFQEKYGDEILKPWGFSEGTGLVSKTTRKKLNEVCFGEPLESFPLKFSLTTVDQPQLVEVANLLKEQWKNLGVEIEIKKFPISELEQDFIKPRDYESLLFGEVLGALPDLFPFWHSSQKRDPGLNLALYENKKTDKILEDVRKSLDPNVQAEKLALFQDILIEDSPAVFLYSPDYIYWVSKEIKGLNIKKIADPSKRFIGIENWYIKTKRVWK